MSRQRRKMMKYTNNYVADNVSSRVFLFAIAIVLHKLLGFEFAMYYLVAYVAVSLSRIEERSRPNDQSNVQKE